MKPTAKQLYIAGLRAGSPVILGFIPVALAYAIMARQAGFTVAQTCGMSLLVFAGASEIMAVGMYAQGATLIAVILATFLLNLRHIIMSTCVFNRMEPTHPLLRLAASFFVTDESFAIFTTERDEHRSVYFFLGLATVTYTFWNLGTFVGAIASALLPDIVSASLGIALYAMFIALLLPSLPGNRQLSLLAILTAMCSTLLSRVMDSSWALIVSTLLCAFLGTFFADPDSAEKEDGRHG